VVEIGLGPASQTGSFVTARRRGIFRWPVPAVRATATRWARPGSGRQREVLPQLGHDPSPTTKAPLAAKGRWPEGSCLHALGTRAKARALSGH
jgi:hypothetical protein